jgi:PPOX class probable FMN-dependent enzyme
VYGVTVPSARKITSEIELREIIGEPTDLVRAKLSGRVNELTRQFIERSPFVCIGTRARDGGMDVSPRGDPPGFVRVLDERTLLVPERPGNRLADTLVNLLSDSRIALLFLIPGVEETFRVNGTAEITDDRELLQASAVSGKEPRLGLIVAVHEAYTQCAKALIRSDLWNPSNHIERSVLPSNGQILKSLNLPDLDVIEHDATRAERYARQEGLY